MAGPDSHLLKDNADPRTMEKSDPRSRYVRNETDMKQYSSLAPHRNNVTLVTWPGPRPVRLMLALFSDPRPIKKETYYCGGTDPRPLMYPTHCRSSDPRPIE